MTEPEAEALVAFIEEHDPRFIGEVVSGAYNPGTAPRMQNQGAAVCCIQRSTGLRAALYLFVPEYTWRARVEMARDKAFLDALARWEEEQEAEEQESANSAHARPAALPPAP